MPFFCFGKRNQAKHLAFLFAIRQYRTAKQVRDGERTKRKVRKRPTKGSNAARAEDAQIFGLSFRLWHSEPTIFRKRFSAYCRLQSQRQAAENTPEKRRERTERKDKISGNARYFISFYDRKRSQRGGGGRGARSERAERKEAVCLI